jgi:lysophospholipase L1-like esterase
LLPYALAGVGALVLWRAARFARDIGAGRALARSTKRFERRLASPNARAVVVGDSMAVGTGAGAGECSIPGLLASTYPHLSVVTRARVGARLEDSPHQLTAAPATVDLIVLCAGGNDVLRLTPHEKRVVDADNAIAWARARAKLVIVMGAANIGKAPIFPSPLSTWLSRRTARVRNALAVACARHGAHYVDFLRVHGDRFSTDRSHYFAVDRLHPSAASYRWCFDAVRAGGAPSMAANSA